MIVFPFHLVPTVLAKPFILREYRITKAWIKNIKNEEIPRYKKLVEKYEEGRGLRPKAMYQGFLEYWEQTLVEKESRFEDLRSIMRKRGIPEE